MNDKEKKNDTQEEYAQAINDGNEDTNNSSSTTYTTNQTHDLKIVTEANNTPHSTQQDDTENTDGLNRASNITSNNSVDQDSNSDFWDEYNRLLNNMQQEHQESQKNSDDTPFYNTKNTFSNKFTNKIHTGQQKEYRSKHITSTNTTESSKNNQNSLHTIPNTNITVSSPKNTPSSGLNNNNTHNISIKILLEIVGSVVVIIIITAISIYVSDTYNNSTNNLTDDHTNNLTNNNTTNPWVILKNQFNDNIVINRLYLNKGEFETIQHNMGNTTNVQSVISKLLQPGYHVVDVGSGIGLNAFYIRHFIGEHGVVYCFEGQSSNFAMLQRSARFNNAQNMKLYNNFVYNSDGKAYLKINTKLINKYQVILNEYEALKHTDLRKIHTISLNTAIKDVREINMLFINTPGNEIAVLQGASSLISRSNNIKIIINWAATSIEKNRQSTINSLIYMGFSFWIIDNVGKSLQSIKDPNTLLHLTSNTYILCARSL